MAGVANGPYACRGRRHPGSGDGGGGGGGGSAGDAVSGSDSLPEPRSLIALWHWCK